MAKHEIPDSEQRHYHPESLNKIFAISSALFLFSIIWMFWKDYAREWRPYQREFRKMEADLTRSSLSEEEQRVQATAEFQEVESALESAVAKERAHAARLSAAQDERDNRQKEYQRRVQLYNFEKADLDTAIYTFEAASVHGQGNADAAREKMDALAAQAALLKVDMEAADTALAAQEEVVSDITARTRELQRAQSKLTRQGDLLRRQLKKLDPGMMKPINQIANVVRDLPILDMANPYYNVRDYQIIVNGITDDLGLERVPKVDRCIACHQGILKKEYAGAKAPFTAHPNLDLFLSDGSPHPVKEFGCTSCHGGRGRGTAFVSAAHMPDSKEQKEHWEHDHHWHKMHHVQYPMYPAKYTEAGCYRCHSAQTSIKSADTLNLGLALIEKAGCYACHAIDTFKDKPRPGPSLRHAASKLDADWAFRWINNPKAFRAHTWMPSYFGQSNNAHLQERTDQEIKAMVAYLFDKSEPYEVATAPAGDAAKGEELVRSVGCLGCHTLGDEAPDPVRTVLSLRREHGPQLVGLKNKTTADWVYSWLKDPKSYHAGTRMPDLRLSDQEAADIAAYLVEGPHGDNETFEGMPVATLDEAVLKDITLGFLARTMTQAQAGEKFGVMSVDDQLVFSGEKLIRKYGCFSCHNIPGLENATPIGTELTEEGSKPISKLDFANLHDKLEHVNFAWFEQKLKDPRSFDEGKLETKHPRDLLMMPNFHLKQREIDALVTVMLALQKKDTALTKGVPRTPKNVFIEEGQKLVRQFNCQACHVMEDEGGAIFPKVGEWYATYAKAAPAEDDGDDEWEVEEEEDEWEEGEEEGEGADPEAAAYNPPILTGEGSKVQPDWLFHFLASPETIRPWLEVRMPTFDLTAEQRNTLVKYFNYLDDQAFPFVAATQIASEGKTFDAAKEMFSDNVFFCQKCHFSGDTAPTGAKDNWAPDLAKARERLKPDWIVEWLRDPQKLLPGTKMPGFWPDGNSSVPRFLEGETDRQMKAIRDYLFTLSGDGEPMAASSN